MGVGRLQSVSVSPMRPMVQQLKSRGGGRNDELVWYDNSLVEFLTRWRSFPHVFAKTERFTSKPRYLIGDELFGNSQVSTCVDS